MKTIEMAWRNLFRQKRRTLITLSALIIGLCGVVVFQGYIGSLMRGFRDSTIRSGIGHLQIAASAGYFEDGEFNPFAFQIKDAESIMDGVRKEPEVQAVFPSTGFTAVAGFGEKSVTLLMKAYPAERMYFTPASGPSSAPEDRFGLGTMIAGSLAAPGQEDHIVLGETAARILGVSPGSVVTLMAVLPDGALNGRDFTVSGIYRASGRDKIFAFTDYDIAMSFTSLGAAPVIHVLTKDIREVGAVAARLPPGVVFRTWHDLATYFVQVNTMFGGFLNVIRAIILLVTLFILANSMNRIVRERMREWGTLRAMGTRKSGVLLLVVLEGCSLGIVGSALGVALGSGVSILINQAGGLPFVTDGQRIVVRILVSGQSVWLNLIPAAMVGALASFLPGLRAVRLTPSECLRQV